MADDKRGAQDLIDWLGFRRNFAWCRARALGGLVGFALMLAVPILFLLAILAAGRLLGDALMSDAGNPSLGTGALIAALLGAPFVIWGTWLRHKTQRLEQEGHMTDRITKAVEQLGAEKTVKRAGGEEETVPNLEVRIGAILSLERIAQDSMILDNGRDHVRVMEILCAYIRENSRVANSVTKNPQNDLISKINKHCNDGNSFLTAYLTALSENSRAQAESDKIRNELAQEIFKNKSADIQTTINVLGRRSPDQIRIERPHTSSVKGGSVAQIPWGIHLVNPVW